MTRVICSLPNASELISGVKFSRLDDGRLISAELDDARAERFASIPGFEIDDDFEEEQKPEPPPPPKLTKAQQRAAEKAAKEAAEKAAAEEAERKAAEAAAKKSEGEGDDNNSTDEVF